MFEDCRRLSIHAIVICSTLLLAQSCVAPAKSIAAPAAGQEPGVVVYGRCYPAAGRPMDCIMKVREPKDNAGALRPAIIFLHGNPGLAAYPGGRQNGFADYAQFFTDLGYVTFVPAWDLRHGQEQALMQVKTAVRYVRANATRYRVDPEQIAVVGHSFGGSWAIVLDVTGDDVGVPNEREKADPVNHWGTSSKVCAVAALPGGDFYPDACDANDGPIFYARGTLDKNFAIPDKHVAVFDNANTPYAWFTVQGAEHWIDPNLKAGYGLTLPQLLREFFAITVRHQDDSIMAFLRVIHTEGGSVETMPGTRLYPKGQTVKLTAVPLAGYRFQGWEQDLQGSAPTVTVTMNRNMTVRAVFVPAR